MADQLEFCVGDAVVVKPGVLCPDKPALSLAGWQGWVTEIYKEEGTVGVDWDSPTLRAMPPDYIRECEIQGLGWASMVLDRDEILPAAPRDSPAAAQAVAEKIGHHHCWDYLGDLNPGIAELLGPLGKASEMTYLNAWEEHLDKALRFPFKARREEQFQRGPINAGDIVEITGLAEIDDKYGLLANARMGRRSFIIPLCDMEAVDENSPNYQPLNDYVVWFANR